MLKLVLIAFLPFLLFFGESSDTPTVVKQDDTTGTLKKMIPEGGSVRMELDTASIWGERSRAGARSSALAFQVSKNSFLPVLVFEGELRAPLPGTINLSGDGNAVLPGHLGRSAGSLVIEALPWGGDFEMVVRDANTGFIFFGIEGQLYDFDNSTDLFTIRDGRLILSEEFADELGRPSGQKILVGNISVSAQMRAIEITELYNGEVRSDVLPASPEAGAVLGPDVVVGDLNGLAQFNGASGTQVGLAVGTDSCNFGTVDLNWFANPSNDHPAIPQNLYRMSGGTTNDRTFEQIGQSNVKHAFTALTNNICGLGCNGVGGTHLGSGCSDPYSASLNADQTRLGSRAWINPFTGVYPRNDSATPNNNHTGHTHNGTSHRILTEIADLNTTLNAGATYYAEGQYVTPHEYAWCQTHPGQCNMNNNVSYRRYNVTGTGSPFSFSAAAATVRAKTAITAWPNSKSALIEPEAGVDGIGTLAWKVTNPSPGIWHYEYVLYNQNIDRAIQQLGLPMGTPVTLSNVGFHAPPQQPAWTADGTAGSAGFSSTPWSSVRNAGDFVWSTETFAQNQNANAVRWGTLYNFRFDANFGPLTRRVTVGFFKTGAPITIETEVPTAMVGVSGRVMNGQRGVTGARVSIQDAFGATVGAAVSDRRGNFQFGNVPAGGSYTLTTVQRRYQFTPQVILVNDTMSGVAISAQP